MSNNKSFENLNNLFDLTENSEEMSEEIDFEETEKLNKETKQKYSLTDLEYIKTELQDRIEKNRIVADELAQSLKVGAPPRLYEVYAKLSTTISEDIMHLVDVEKTITDYQVTETKEELHKQQLEQRQLVALKKMENKTPNAQQNIQNQTNTYIMTSKQMLDELNKMNNNNSNVITNMDDLPQFNLD